MKRDGVDELQSGAILVFNRLRHLKGTERKTVEGGRSAEE